MKVAALVITDGRGDYLERMVDSFQENFVGTIHSWHGVNDSGDPEYGEWLERTYPEITWHHHLTRQGLAQAIRTGWSHLNADFVIHLEDDCEFVDTIELARWLIPLLVNPNLTQVCLLRGPQSPEEHAAGGILGLYRQWGHVVTGYTQHGVRWAEQGHLFSLQPCVYPRWVYKFGWPEHGGEREFTDRLKTPRFAYLLDDPPLYTHAGYGIRMAGWQV